MLSQRLPRLFLLAKSEHLINLLLDHGAEMDAEDYGFKRTPLQLAACHDQADNLKALANRGADIECPTTSQRTALHDAIAYNHLCTVEAVVAQGADLDAVDSHGRTVFHIAASFGGLDMIKALCSAVMCSGIKTLTTTVCDSEGNTASDNYYNGRKQLYYGETSLADKEEQTFISLEKVIRSHCL